MHLQPRPSQMLVKDAAHAALQVSWHHQSQCLHAHNWVSCAGNQLHQTACVAAEGWGTSSSLTVVGQAWSEVDI